MAIDGLHREFIGMEWGYEPMLGVGIQGMFLVSKPIFPRIAVVNGLQCVAHVAFVLHFVRMCVAKGERFD
jgi:hypothetical protein